VPTHRHSSASSPQLDPVIRAAVQRLRVLGKTNVAKRDLSHPLPVASRRPASPSDQGYSETSAEAGAQQRSRPAARRRPSPVGLRRDRRPGQHRATQDTRTGVSRCVHQRESDSKSPIVMQATSPVSAPRFFFVHQPRSAHEAVQGMLGPPSRASGEASTG